MPPDEREDDPLEQLASRSSVEALHRAGLLSAAARRAAIARVGDAFSWQPELSRVLGGLGSALLLAAVLAFFAGIWAELSRPAEFLLALLVLMVCLGTAATSGLDRALGRWLLLAATVLVGGGLAVVEHALPMARVVWPALATWALLTAPWALLSRFLPHLLTWLGIAQLALASWWLAVHPLDPRLPAGLCLALAGINAIALFGLELGAGLRSGLRSGLQSGLQSGFEVAAGSPAAWARRLLLAATLVGLTVPSFVLVVQADDTTGAAWFALALLPLAIGATLALHLRWREDLPAVALAHLAGLVVGLGLLGRLLFRTSEAWPSWLLFGLLVTGAVAASVWWLSALQRRPRSRRA